MLRGEGPTDIGIGVDNEYLCEGDRFLIGPLTVLVDQIIERYFGYSILDVEACGYASGTFLSRQSKELRPTKKGLRLTGKKRAKETLYYFDNARALSRVALQKQAETGGEVVAILFRGTDGSASAGRGEWADKHKSRICRGKIRLRRADDSDPSRRN